tara:strand:- start:332 stop:442 length:111 start_codon:yes stop_codon:yes gene_type:complete
MCATTVLVDKSLFLTHDDIKKREKKIKNIFLNIDRK